MRELPERGELVGAVQANDLLFASQWFTEVGEYMRENEIDVGVNFFNNECRQFTEAELKDAYLQAEELKHEEVKQILLEGQFVKLYNSKTQQTQNWSLRSWPSQYAPLAKPVSTGPASGRTSATTSDRALTTWSPHDLCANRLPSAALSISPTFARRAITAP